MRIVLEDDKAERLEDATRAGVQWIQHFSHAVNVARMGLKCNFHEIAFRERHRQLQESPGCGNDLKATLGADPIAQLN